MQESAGYLSAGKGRQWKLKLSWAYLVSVQVTLQVKLYVLYKIALNLLDPSSLPGRIINPPGREEGELN